MSDTSADAGTSPGLSPIGVYGEVVSTFTAIRNTSSNSLFLVGEDGPEKVLVPFAELNFIQSLEDEDEEQMLFSAIVPLENMAFLLASLAEDMERNCASLAAAA